MYICIVLCIPTIYIIYKIESNAKSLESHLHGALGYIITSNGCQNYFYLCFTGILRMQQFLHIRLSIELSTIAKM